MRTRKTDTRSAEQTNPQLRARPTPKLSAVRIVPRRKKETPKEAQQLRISEAVDHLDQANAIFNYVLFALNSFGGVGDPAWNHRLAAVANMGRLLEGYAETDTENITRASREIALRRLPRLLCIALVSAIETCFQDLTEIQVRELHPSVSNAEIEDEIRIANSGGPIQYLPRLGKLLKRPSLAGPDWHWFLELVATRNVLVHASQPVADKRYVKNAGPLVRAKEGQPLKVDNTYLLEEYLQAKASLMDMLRVQDAGSHLSHPRSSL